MIVGSDNLNLRSWTNDSELSCAVIDEQRDEREPVDPGGHGDGARVLARETRLRLWREHLGRDDGDDADLRRRRRRDRGPAPQRARPLDAWCRGRAARAAAARPPAAATAPARCGGGRSGGRTRSTASPSTPTAAPGRCGARATF